MSSDPEADLDNFAARNPVADQGDDVYLTQSAWAELSGQSYAEDIGNGTIAQVVADPISSANPLGMVRLYLNGHEVATVNPQYQPEYDGWYKHTSKAATYSYYTGAQTSSGTRMTEEPQPTFWTPHEKQSGYNLYRDNPRFAYFLDRLLPSRAYAQGLNCNTFMRNALIGLGAMAWSARTGNIGGYFLAWGSVVNNVHGFARCKENERRAGTVKPGDSAPKPQ